MAPVVWTINKKKPHQSNYGFIESENLPPKKYRQVARAILVEITEADEANSSHPSVKLNA